MSCSHSLCFGSSRWFTMVVCTSLFVVNKHGSLLYQRDFGSSNLSSNDKIRMASMFHSLSAIAVQTAPTTGNSGNKPFGFLQPPGITSIDSNNFRLQCYHTITGIKFFAIVPPATRDMSDILQQVYVSYTDYVLKDVFHDPDMPIRSKRFDDAINATFVEFKS